jgi:formylglycine-generating enzyme required for sulfatase activity
MKNHRNGLTWLLLTGCLVLMTLACAVTGNSSREEIESLAETVQAKDALVVEGQLVVSPTQVWPQDGMEMVKVMEGQFLMGGRADEERSIDWEKPLHIVHVDTYWIDRTEVSNAMFAAFVAATGHVSDAEKAGMGYVSNGSGRTETAGAYWKHPMGPDSSIDGLEDHPVMMVSWNDAAAYCAWAGRRLPTEAEWEKAARGIDGRFYPWGEEFDSSLVNADDEELLDEYSVECSPAGCDGYDVTSPVGSFEGGASPYGVLDMAGNLWEWAGDYYDDAYFSISPAENPTGPSTGERRVLRGGSWLNNTYDMRTTYRYGQKPDYRSDKLGFRCAMDETP